MITAGVWALVALVFLGWLWLLTCGLAGAARAVWRKLRAAWRWLQHTSPATTQAIQDAPGWGEHADTACALTVGPQLPADQWERIERQAHDLYDTYRIDGLLPGETRTTWTREDYTS